MNQTKRDSTLNNSEEPESKSRKKDESVTMQNDGPKLLKVFRDPIHGSIQIHPLLVKIIDTPQFQRLRNLSQLGAVSRVFPGARHSRFEHCIGVSHLAGKLVRRLQKHQPELNIDERDILCVEIAGLCHDLGHGPFSHLFDNMFLPLVGSMKKHEEMSCEMFNEILATNDDIKRKLNGEEIDFIKQQIDGTRKRKTYQGNKKDFLYEIVANKRNGVDVDKWDYLVRDHYYLGLPCAFDTHIMDHVRALEVEVNGKKEYMICTRDIKAESVYNMFQTRRRLHSVALHHRVVNAINFMICDAFVYAKDDLRYGNNIPLAKCIEDPEAFLHLTDDVYYELLKSRNEKLSEASEIIKRIEKRDIYPCVGNNIVQKVSSDSQLSHDAVKNKIENHWREFIEDQADFKDHTADFHLHVVTIDFGKGLQDPVSGNMWFYKKPKPGENVNRATQLSRERISSMLPSQFSEYLVRLYCKYSTKETEKIDKAKMLFTKWRDAFNVEHQSQLQLHSIYCDEDNETRDLNST